MPDKIKRNSKIAGIELDRLTCKLTQALYKDINIINQPLQEVDFINKQYDLIIGNPPYSNEKVMDKQMPDISNYSIHHYFVAKCVRLLKPNGVLAFVLPSFLMDIPYKNTRAIVDKEAVLVDAFRLPDNLFNQASVTVDIVFMRKTGNKVNNFVDTVCFEQNGKKDSINKYWRDKPNRILGKLGLKWVECYKRHVPTCSVYDTQQVLNSLTNCSFTLETKNNFKQIAVS